MARQTCHAARSLDVEIVLFLLKQQFPHPVRILSEKIQRPVVVTKGHAFGNLCLHRAGEIMMLELGIVLDRIGDG